MKRRFIETRKILAVALGAAAAGCSPTSSSEGPAIAAAIPAAQPEPAAAAPPPPELLSPVLSEGPPHSNDPALLALRDELARETRGALKAPDHYRPLCDKDGYPLVGNVTRKWFEQDYQPSQLCADLHAQAKR
jgi:hypothetical protein